MHPALALALAPLAALPLTALPLAAPAAAQPAPAPAASAPARLTTAGAAGPDALVVARGASATSTVPASPTPTQTPHRDHACPVVDLDVRSDGRVGGETTVVATRRGGDPDRPVTVVLERVSPGERLLVRSATVQETATWTLRLGESHRFQGRAASNTDQCFPVLTGRDTAEVEIAPELSIGAVRQGVRDYVFSGRVLPGRGQAVSLYRVESDTGRRVLTARGVVGADGTYRIARRFTGSGRFGFLVTVPRSGTNSAGESRVRPTVVH